MLYELLIMCFIVFILCVSCLILPWINLYRHNTLKSDNTRLKLIIAELLTLLKKEELNLSSSLEHFASLHTPEKSQAIPQKQHSNHEQVNVPNNKEAIVAVEQKIIIEKEVIIHKEKQGFEQKIGSQLIVWIGGIALALSAFFLVKYSLDHNLLSPFVRLTLGALFGAGLLYGAHIMHHSPMIANQVRIGQSLAGAGIVVCYIVLFAATSLYHFIPHIMGIMGMGGITLMAIILSLRHGYPIALFALVGGFVTPALFNSDNPSAPLLFAYLYFITLALMILVKRQNWWILSIPTLIGTFIWVSLWFMMHFTQADSLWIGLFLIAVTGTIAISSNIRDTTEILKNNTHIKKIVNYLCFTGSIILISIMINQANFGLLEWGLFAFITLGGIGLAYFNAHIYRFVPYICFGINVIMLLLWKTDVLFPLNFSYALLTFAIIFIVPSYFIMWRNQSVLLWAGLIGATSLIYYLVAYFKIHDKNLIDHIPLIWGLIAFGFAAFAIDCLRKVKLLYNNHQDIDYLLAIFALMATSFITIGLSVELTQRFIPLAIASEICVISWLAIRFSIKALRPICCALLCIFTVLLLPQIILLFQLFLYSTLHIKIVSSASVPFVEYPVLFLGIPAGLFMISSYWLRIIKDNKLVNFFELAAVLLFGVMAYYIVQDILHPNAYVLFPKVDFTQRGITTNGFFVFGLICCIIGHYFKRIVPLYSGMAIGAIAIFRIVLFDILIQNPIWTPDLIKGFLPLNALLLPYGLPIIWLSLFNKILAKITLQHYTTYLKGFMLALLLILVTLNLRFYFHGSNLTTGITSNLEIYGYSALWLVFAISLLIWGVLKHHIMSRYISLGMMIFVIGKVFIYDASHLQDLYSVFSFLGLGITLIALSWFYSRFIFPSTVQHIEP
ncbi:MAG: putative membrane protein [Dasania sp.]|jgi:uncharacterized membrane protein